MRFLLPLCCAALLIGASAVSPASGQGAPARPPLPPSPLPGVLLPRAPSVTSGAPAARASGDPMPDARIDVGGAVIEGMTIYPPETFATLTAGLVGPGIALERIDEARLAILSRYRDDGYTLTAVTAVVEADLHVRLRVTEGRIASVRLDGDIGPAGVQVLRFLARLTEPRVIDTATLERALLLAGDVPGVNLRAILRPSADEPGALTLVAQVSRQSIGGQLTGDNRAFVNVGPEQLLGQLDFNSFSEYGEHTQLQIYRTLNGAQIFGNASVDTFIGADGLRVRLYGGTGVSTPTGSFRAIDYAGRTALFGSEVSYPLIRSRRQTLSVVAVFDVIESEVEENRQISSADSLRVVRAGADYALADQWLGDARGAVNVLTVRLSQGVAVLGATRRGSVLASRADQEPAFHKIAFDLSRTQTVFQPWDGASVALLGVAAGQFSPNVLPSAEKYFLGGSRLARGFYYGQVTGDRALAATLEVQLNTVNTFDLFGTATEVSAQLYGFYDWAQAWESQAQDHGRRLRSAGLGLRVIPSPKLEIDLEAVHRLTRFPTGSGPGIAPLPGTAFYWRIVSRF